MRFRRFGRSELEVSEVGFGVWTLASDWWGKVDDKAGLVHAALDAGVTFFDTAPVFGDDGFGETILAEILGRRDDVIVTTKVGYDIDAPVVVQVSQRHPIGNSGLIEAPLTAHGFKGSIAPIAKGGILRMPVRTELV